MKKPLIPLVLILTALLLNVQTGYSAPQVIYTVDRSDDAGGLACTAAANDCTLRSAIQLANTSPANDSILFDGSRTVTLSSPLPELTGNGTLIAAWPAQDVNINANGATNVFTISGDNISISGLDIYNGSTANSTLIILKGTAENVKIYQNVIGYWSTTTNSCGTYKGGITGVVMLNDDPSVSGTRLYIYGNQFRCLTTGINLTGSSAVIGENDSGSAGAEQENQIFENTHGILLSGGSGSGSHRILNNVIHNQSLTGISIDNSSGTHIYGNEIYGNGTDGVYLVNGAQSNTIGCALSSGFDAARRNFIYNNGANGIQISGNTTSGLITRFNYVSCNYIGLQADGSPAGNGDNGVYLAYGATANYIGSTTDKENVIGSNGEHGVYIYKSDNNLVQGNEIGSYNASSDRGNGLSGVAIWDPGSTGNLIGGANANNMNTITFNNTFGIHLLNAGAQNKIQRNLVGNLGRGNVSGGIVVVNTNQTQIGASFTCTDVSGADCLLVYGNNTTGIALTNATGTSIAGGTHVFNNGDNGIALLNSSDNTIYPQYIGGNAAAGISVTGNSSTGNKIWVRERIYDNGGLPIDLNGDGFTPNDNGDADSGPNDLLNFPVTTTPAGSINVAGTACANCLVDVYARNESGGYYRYLGFTAANSSGNWTYDLSGDGVTQDDVAFVATDSSGNSSEMSPLGGIASYPLFLPVIIR